MWELGFQKGCNSIYSNNLKFGFCPLTPETGVRFPVGSPLFSKHNPQFYKHLPLKIASIHFDNDPDFAWDKCGNFI